MLESMSGFALGFLDEEVVRFGETQPEGYDQDWRTGTEPKEASPTMRSCWHQCAVENGSEEVASGIALLKESGENAAGFVWKIF
jgi:hypothetical protein